MEIKKIAFIGTGVMGASVVKHLLDSNHEVTVYTRTKEKARSLIEAGAAWGDTVGATVKDAELIFTMVGYPVDVEEIYFGEGGIFSIGKAGQILIDMTTSSPALAVQIANAADELQMAAIDAPVSGGDIGAKNGTLSIMCGGKEEIFNAITPILSIFGNQIVYQGLAGSGQHAKMCNQIAIAMNMIGVCESLTYAEKAGLDPEIVLKSISSGAAGSWSLSNLAPRMLNGDFEPGFYVKHFLKDINIALTEAEAMQLSLPGLRLAREMYEQLVEKGFGEKGTQVLYKNY
ncbi:NAD(P)-dependent oxidoreductase [Sporosarcina sp. ANT_H38]|uniref:NAD(P)-dependent oxidoreductase n=1 Tax=Sporosarcina sp. ANT_H38 TaxID=2597358 RepID=UPI0011F3D217|nr:NAD(P)-dependent oxidoreductase [Sporosarcina sp. ANT_H38]KAA0966678.1 NAD(P)-dependent oxidoreductase [Sporosarcina sp. ANT_H38]